MGFRVFVSLGALALALALVEIPASAQQPQIPTLQVCNGSAVTTPRIGAIVRIFSRVGPGLTGTFIVFASLKCDRASYPAGTLAIRRISMTDSITGDVVATSIDQLTTTGKHTPTAYLNGKCRVENPTASVPACRFWMTIADNTQIAPGTPDVIGFLVFRGDGTRVAYGTGPVVDGDVNVAPTGF